MATWDMQLVSRIVRSGDINTIIQKGITQDDCLTNEARAIFSALMSYFTAQGTSGAVLGPNAVQRMFPNFQLCDDISMTTEALCSEVRKQRLVIETVTVSQQAMELVQKSPMAAIAQLQQKLSDLHALGMGKSTDVYFHDSFSRGVRRMEMLEQGLDLSVCPWPWDPLQHVTRGIQHDDYVIIYGRPKSKKTWVLASLIAWCVEQRKRLVIYTKEMTADNIFMRAGACLAQVRYQEFRNGQLNWDEKQSIYTVERMLYQAEIGKQVVCLSAQDANGADTVPWLKSKVEEYQPDIVFIDGIYLMTDARSAKKDNERVRNISRDIRQMVLETKRPVIATLQANRAAAKNSEANLDELAFSDGPSQDATLIMRAIAEKNKPTIALVMDGSSREFHLNGFRIYGIPALNFDYEGPLTDKEIEKAKQSDMEPEDKGAKKATKKNGQMTAGEAVMVAKNQLKPLFQNPQTP